MSATKLNDGTVTGTFPVADIPKIFAIINDGMNAHDEFGNNYTFDTETSRYTNDTNNKYVEFRDDGTASFYNGSNSVNGTHNGTANVAAAGDGSASGDPFITPMM